jgi:hypothetical protein
LKTQGKSNLQGDVQVTGNLTVTGQISGFPRPNFDSGWVEVPAGGNQVITHNLGGNPEDYMVDMTFKYDGDSGIHNITYGGDARPAAGGNTEWKGAFWEQLTSTTIKVTRYADDVRCEYVRIRIWVYR